MRIGIDGVSFAFEFTGVARYLLSVLRELVQVAENEEIIVYAPVKIKLHLPGNNWRLRIIPHLLSHRPTLWTQFVLPRILAEDGVDVFWAQPTNLPLWRRHSYRSIYTVHDLVPYVLPESMQLRALVRMRLLMKVQLKKADVVVCVSDFTKRMLKNYFPVADEKIRVVKEGVAGVFRPVPQQQAVQIVGEKFKLSGDYILFVSTVEPRKDHRTLFKALELIPDAPVLVLCGGRGWRSKPIFQDIERLERAGRVRYLGRVADEDLCALYSTARLTVYPSRYEGFGLPVLEAMACGCPVLCSDSSSLPEVGGDAAAYFRTGDFADLALKLKGLLSDQKQLQAMARAGLERVKQFSFRAAAEELLRIFKEEG